MRLLKAQNTNLRNIYGKGVKYDYDDQVIADSDRALLVPKGAQTLRPGEAGIATSATDGHVRYNTTTDQLEAYQNGAWRNMRFKEPRAITQQTVGTGDDVDQTGVPSGGSRVFQWGYNPVGGASSFDAALTPNDLVGISELGSVTVTIS
jgi:hypothetical protein